MCELIKIKESRICLFCNKISLELIEDHKSDICDYICNKCGIDIYIYYKCNQCNRKFEYNNLTPTSILDIMSAHTDWK